MIDLPDYMHFHNVEMIDFFLRNIRITLRRLEGKHQGIEACEPLSEYL